MAEIPEYLLCCVCGDDQVSGRGTVYWIPEQQRFKGEGGDNWYCDDCGTECDVFWATTVQLSLFGLTEEDLDHPHPDYDMTEKIFDQERPYAEWKWD